MQTHSYGWLTPRRLRRLTLAAMVAAGLVSTIGFSGSAASAARTAAHHAATQAR